MKRLVAFACAFLVLLGSGFMVGAQGSAEISLDVGVVKTNRLFDVALCMISDSAISGGQFELTYDSSMVEYRDVSSEYFETEAKDYGDKVHIVFAAADGVNTEGLAEIISIEFKCIAKGEFDLQLEVVECIDDKLQDVVVSSSLTTIEVDENTVTAKAKSEKQNKPASKKSAGKSEMSQAQEKDSYDIISATDSNYVNKAVLCGVCAGILVIVAFALGMLYRKKADDTKDKIDTNKTS